MEPDTRKQILIDISRAIDRCDSSALKISAARLADSLSDSDSEKARKAANVLKIMGRVGDTVNTHKVFELLVSELAIDISQ